MKKGFIAAVVKSNQQNFKQRGINVAMSTVWLIRHGESQSNAGLPTLSPVFPGLTKRGIVQAESIAQAFTRVPSLIITSRYKRTKQTALPTTERFPNAKQGQWVV